MLLEITPVTVIFLLILAFNINLTSGALHSFIFFTQLISNSYKSVYQTIYGQQLGLTFSFFNMVYGVFNLEILEIVQLSFCLFKNANIMDLLLMKYITTLYALFLIFFTILVLRLNSVLNYVTNLDVETSAAQSSMDWLLFLFSVILVV